MNRLEGLLRQLELDGSVHNFVFLGEAGCGKSEIAVNLALALAEITDPEYLIMDEISNGLDYETMLDLKKRLRGWSERKTILLTGHQFGFYNDLVDDVFLIRDRKLILVEEEFRNSEKTLEEIYDKEISHA